MQREARNQHHGRAIGVACDVNQRTIGIAAAGHQGCQGALPAAPQQRPDQPRGIEIGGGSIVHSGTSRCKKSLFPAKPVSI